MYDLPAVRRRRSHGARTGIALHPGVSAFGLLLLLMLVGCGGANGSALPTPVESATLPPLVGPDWTTYHRDSARSGYIADTPDPKRLIRAWSVPLDGAVYAEPLVIGSRVVAATENNSLYALDAHTGHVDWHVNIGTPVPSGDLPCGDISPLGITGTPVYDPATQLVFAVAEVSGPSHTPSHALVGVAITTGQVRLRRSADVPGMDPRPHQQRAALALSQGLVYIAYGGLFGDCGNYRGRVVAARTDGQGSLLSFQVPTTREGGIWAPPGPSIDASGRLFVGVGNGAATLGAWDHSDSVLRLSPQLQLEDGFAPTTWAQENANDEDLGSMGPVLLTDGWVLAAGKSGEVYLLRADALGGVGGQARSLSGCHAYGGAASLGAHAFLPCVEGVSEVTVEPGPKLTLGWRAAPAGSPVIGGHTVYSLSSQGALYALDSQSGTVRTSLAMGAVSRFATPTIFGNALIVGTLAGVTAVQIV
jgi:outer membrane protein assembly factor BamB